MTSEQEKQENAVNESLFDSDVLSTLIDALQSDRSILVCSSKLEYAEQCVCAVVGRFHAGSFIHWDMSPNEASEYMQQTLKDLVFISLKSQEHDFDSLLLVKKADAFIISGLSSENTYLFTKLLLKATLIAAVQSETPEDALRHLTQGLRNTIPQYDEAQARESLLMRLPVLVEVRSGGLGTPECKVIDSQTLVR